MTNGCFVTMVESSEQDSGVGVGGGGASEPNLLQRSTVFLPFSPSHTSFLLFSPFLSIGGMEWQEKRQEIWKRQKIPAESLFCSLCIQLSPPLQPPLIQGNKAEVTRTYVFQLLLDCYFQPGPASGWHQAMMAEGQHVVGMLADVKNLTLQLSN